jgi:hypothetical protein
VVDGSTSEDMFGGKEWGEGEIKQGVPLGRPEYIVSWPLIGKTRS